jgi:hypothetical protein
MITRTLRTAAIFVCLLAGCASSAKNDNGSASKTNDIADPSPYAIYQPTIAERFRDSLTDTGRDAGDDFAKLFVFILLSPIYLLAALGVPLPGGAK